MPSDIRYATWLIHKLHHEEQTKNKPKIERGKKKVQMDEFDRFFLKCCRFYKYLLLEIARFKKYLKYRKVCKIGKGHSKMSKIIILVKAMLQN